MFKEHFPLLKNSGPIYLDTAASSQKPDSVLKTMDAFYRSSYANVHRGQCWIAVQATTLYEKARQTVARFIGADPSEIIFTKGATESINLVANGIESSLNPGDEILVSIAEHHANFVPWQQLASRTGAIFKTFGVLPNGQFDLDDFARQLSPKTKMVAITQLSNVLGIVNPVHEMIKSAHARGIPVLIDGAQGVAHMPVSMSDLDCDYYVFSGHKIYGPTGIGVLYGKYEILESMPPLEGGGEMIDQVTFEKTTFALPPDRFEAGTPPIAEVIGLGAAIDWINQVGIEAMYQHEQEILKYAEEKLRAIPGLHILGNPKHRGSLLSFTLDSAHPHDAATLLDEDGIAVRSGHHCAQPVMQRFCVPATIRASFGAYTQKWEIDRLVEGLLRVNRIFSV